MEQPESQENAYDGELSFEDALAALTHIPDEPFAETAPEAEPEPAPEEPSDAPEAAEAAPEPEPAEEQPEPVEVEPEPQSKALSKLIEREHALEQRERKIREEQEALKELRAKVDEYKHWQEDIKVNPIDFLRANLPEGTDLRQLATDLWYEANPDKAPRDYRAVKEARAARAEAVKAQRVRQQTQQETEQGGEQALQQYIGSMKAYTASVDAAKYPLVSRYAKKAGDDRTVSALFAHANRRFEESGGQVVLTPEQAAAELEKELDLYASLGREDKPAESSDARLETKEAPTQPATLRNSHSQVQPNRVPEDELSDYALRKKAFMGMGYSEADAERLAAD